MYHISNRCVAARECLSLGSLCQWRTRRRRVSTRSAWAVRGVELGAGEILLTSMDADGTLAGYDLPLTRAIADAVNVPVIASGGAGTALHFAEVLTDGHADAALAASLFHDGKLKIADLKRELQSRGVPVRFESLKLKEWQMQKLLSELKYDADGLIPAIVQDADTNEVLMMAYINKESLQLTMERARHISGHAAGASCGIRETRREIYNAWSRCVWIAMRIRCCCASIRRGQPAIQVCRLVSIQSRRI